jgi:hypothetical protein
MFRLLSFLLSLIFTVSSECTCSHVLSLSPPPPPMSQPFTLCPYLLFYVPILYGSLIQRPDATHSAHLLVLKLGSVRRFEKEGPDPRPRSKAISRRLRSRQGSQSRSRSVSRSRSRSRSRYRSDSCVIVGSVFLNGEFGVIVLISSYLHINYSIYDIYIIIYLVSNYYSSIYV